MNWIALIEVLYFILMLLVILRVLYDTRSGSKTLAYILFIILVPLVGMLFYFSFGVNYRKRKLYSKKLIKDKILREKINRRIQQYSENVIVSDIFPKSHTKLAEFIEGCNASPLTANNSVTLLLNGEEKFPALLEALKTATSHIHLEYYIYEDDFTGNAIADILVQKAQEGVAVRFLYDDFGSHGLSKKFIQRLNEAGVETAPFYKVTWYALANRINYRNHRKIIIIDGKKSFVGGINISDKYRNDIDDKKELYWRDTHLMIKGRATFFLQYLFLCDWNFCHDIKLEFEPSYFPIYPTGEEIKKELVQIVASGPDSDLPVILYSLIEAIGAAEKKILVTSPYFIPGESLVDHLVIAAKSGVEVKLLIPGISDSKIVNAAARSYYTEILRHGVRIFEYQKGFVHAKTIVIDDSLCMIGSANMDYRSFDLNFEVNAIVYSEEINAQLNDAFYNDLKDAVEIDAEAWLGRPKYIYIWEKFVRRLSPFL
ncbi:MAG: cardiolipin synthase [Ginsengibacter sp.]